MMILNLNQIAQIAVPVADPDRSEAFYRDIVGLRKLYRFGDLCFFDCAGVRLLLDKVAAGKPITPCGCIYFRCADIALTCAELERRGVYLTPSLDRADGRSRPFGWRSSRTSTAIRLR